ncbi:MAG: hypothetical protein U5L45_07900 [Saprospiraceae bacterium]|nr:hypothetical protein [Saprospiraceae bacterium]
MNNLSSFCASEASAKVPFNAYFEFMYGFKIFFTIKAFKSINIWLLVEYPLIL